MIERLALAHWDCDADFNRNKGAYKLGLLFRAFANILWILFQQCFSHYCILTMEVCKKMKYIVFYYLNVSFTQSFYCDILCMRNQYCVHTCTPLMV